MSDIRCPNCNATLFAAVLADGWCEECGKKLPRYLTSGTTPPTTQSAAVALRATQPWKARSNAQEPATPELDPACPELPRDTEPLCLPGYLKPACGLFIGAACVGVLCVPFGLAGWVVGGIVAATMVIVALVMFVGEFAWVPRVRRDLTELQRGGHLVKWEYSQAEWQRFLRAEWRRVREWALIFLIGLVVSVALGAVTVGCWATGSLVAKKVLFGLLLLTVSVTVAGAVVSGASLAAVQRAKRAIGTAYIGRGMACFNGKYFLWNRLGWSLATVRIVPGDCPVLELEVRYSNQQGREVRIPIPHGGMDEARDLVRKLKGG